MGDRDRLSAELGNNDVDGIELSDQELDEVAGGSETTIISSTTIIRGKEDTSV